jgi:hypothetical protein
MVSMDIYLNETTRHADVILPGVSPLEDLHYDVAFPQLSWRNHARYSPPVFPRRRTSPRNGKRCSSWRPLRRARVPTSTPMRWTTPSLLRRAQSLFGTHAPAVIAATEAYKGGPNALLDLALRSGPYGDGFGRILDGLTLAKVHGVQRLGRHRPGRIAAPHSRNAAHPQRQGRTGTTSPCWQDLKRRCTPG